MQIQNSNNYWFISSYEYDEFDLPRKIDIVQLLNIENRNVLEVNFDRPIFGQEYGFGGENIFTGYLLGRFEELDISNLDFKDVHVLIGCFSNQSERTIKELKNIGWAVIYGNEKDAKDHKII